ncbi:HTH-type transcriptional regulator DmlR [Brucella sp. NBRC 12953]|uniref:LysR family transcriptional regulator n=1 Tax=Brucella sp. NBRC 12953 TaxID=3075481 RepID=UPI0030AB7243
MDNRAGEMDVFLRVVDTGNFSEAARQLHIAPSSVSKLIGRLEARLGVRLLERSTRSLSLTAEGRRYYERGQGLLAELDDIERDVSHGGRGTGGIVRITSSVGFATVAVEPLLPEFWRLHPNIVVDLSLSDEVIDLYLDRTDVAFRIGVLGDSSLTATKLGTARRRIVASPHYLERHGVPATARDLDAHQCLGFNFRRSTQVSALRNSRRTLDSVTHQRLLANNGETVRRMAVLGMGIAQLGEYHIRNELKTGALVEILTEETSGDTEDLHAVFMGGERLPHRVRALLDFMVPRLRHYLATGGAEQRR